LKGTCTYVQLVPARLNFGTQPVGSKSLPRRITLTNKGDAPVNITGILINGADAGDFAETNNCGKQVASGASCFIKVTFKPLMKGKRTADVSIHDSGGGSPQEVALLRRELGPKPLLVVPGIRPAGVSAQDQRRTGTPREAVQAGASLLVLGRPLRDAPDPAAAADSICAELR